MPCMVHVTCAQNVWALTKVGTVLNMFVGVGCSEGGGGGGLGRGKIYLQELIVVVFIILEGFLGLVNSQLP